MEQPPVVEEVKQQSSAEATPKKSKKKQNKIKIEEVDAVVEEPAPEVCNSDATVYTQKLQHIELTKCQSTEGQN